MLKLPENMRAELSKSLGFLLTDDINKNIEFVINLIKEKSPPKVVLIGDIVLSNFLKFGITPNLGIYDRRSRRLPFDLKISSDVVVKNPAGHISYEAISIIKKLLNSHGNYIIYVDGEEDLLALPAILYSPIGSFIIYGVPDKGMALVVVNEEIKRKVYEIINRFERVP
ncbi:MAG: DUF359 domain-containing protein [Candidatus Methanomethyliaceae archaeon]|nr:DUF359 domain-containing protein [Candidatus Methanomethyliaceae archaeon]MCX8170151.1 DUF359 domain-containing protein [Candidatus Methanomethyliaceae archaeon]MDW7970391.1 DUF359 domain-containing protein [Nitrososphaerota archaeon]